MVRNSVIGAGSKGTVKTVALVLLFSSCAHDPTVNFSMPVENGCLLGAAFYDSREEIQLAYQQWTTENQRKAGQLVGRYDSNFKPQTYRDPAGVAAWVEPTWATINDETRLCYKMHVPMPTPENYREVMCLIAHEEMHPFWNQWHDDQHLFTGC